MRLIIRQRPPPLAPGRAGCNKVTAANPAVTLLSNLQLWGVQRGIIQLVALSESQKSQLRIAPYCGSVNVDRTGRSSISQAGLIVLLV